MCCGELKNITNICSYLRVCPAAGRQQQQSSENSQATHLGKTCRTQKASCRNMHLSTPTHKFFTAELTSDPTWICWPGCHIYIGSAVSESTLTRCQQITTNQQKPAAYQWLLYGTGTRCPYTVCGKWTAAELHACECVCELQFCL